MAGPVTIGELLAPVFALLRTAGVREDRGVRRTITGRAAGRTMTLGDLRKFLATIDNIGDEAAVKAKVTFRNNLRALTIEDDEPGLREYLLSIGLGDDDEVNEVGEVSEVRSRPRSRAKS
jgi:hypothetical protein